MYRMYHLAPAYDIGGLPHAASLASPHRSAKTLRPLRVALEGDQRMREEVREGHELISRIAPHWQVRAEVPHLVPLLHLKQGERALNVLLRVEILPACGRAGQLVAVALLYVALALLGTELSLRLGLGLGGRALGSLALGQCGGVPLSLGLLPLLALSRGAVLLLALELHGHRRRLLRRGVLLHSVLRRQERLCLRGLRLLVGPAAGRTGEELRLHLQASLGRHALRRHARCRLGLQGSTVAQGVASCSCRSSCPRRLQGRLLRLFPLLRRLALLLHLALSRSRGCRQRLPRILREHRRLLRLALPPDDVRGSGQGRRRDGLWGWRRAIRRGRRVRSLRRILLLLVHAGLAALRDLPVPALLLLSPGRNLGPRGALDLLLPRADGPRLPVPPVVSIRRRHLPAHHGRNGGASGAHALATRLGWPVRLLLRLSSSSISALHQLQRSVDDLLGRDTHEADAARRLRPPLRVVQLLDVKAADPRT
mmetsp:Transcript_42900/g.127148  ORF Transcript_42900/g.127148 Transcript_42900/m.127148 type:complete len:482 (-) Transcript_42900:1458-2903(-)